VSRYRCVDAQKAAGFPVVAACRAAGVTPSAFDAWAANREQGPRTAEQAGAALVAEIRTIHRQSSGTYGSPPVHAELRRRGWRVNHKRVERLMAIHGIVGHRPRRRRGLTKADTSMPPAPDLLGGCSTPTGPTWPGAATSPPSRPTRVGCTWRRCWSWRRGSCWAGRWVPATTPSWSVMPGRGGGHPWLHADGRHHLPP
jgi:putative transposase